MAILGFLSLCIIGIFLILAGIQSTIGGYNLSGKVSWEYLIFLMLVVFGGVILGFALENSPISVTLRGLER